MWKVNEIRNKQRQNISSSGLITKPCAKIRVKTKTQAINEMAKSFSDLGELHQEVTNDGWSKQRTASRVFKVPQRTSRTQSLARVEMMELFMKFTNIHPSAHYQHTPTQIAQQPATRSITTVLLHLGSSIAVPTTTWPIPIGNFSSESSHWPWESTIIKHWLVLNNEEWLCWYLQNETGQFLKQFNQVN